MKEERTHGARRLEKTLVLLLGGYFLARLLFFAVTISPTVPPDEFTHVAIAKLYSATPLLIHDSPESFEHGLVTRVPFLYHLVMGKLAALNLLGVEPVLWLRMWNVLLSVFTVAAAYRLARRVTENWTARILMLVMVTNTLMFSFLGAAVSYDNLVNLLAVLAVDALVSFLRTKDEHALLRLGVFVLLGGLTKLSFLPLMLALALVLIVERRSDIVADLARLFGALRKARPVTLLLAGTLVITLFANFWIYGVNVVKYRRLVPGCDQVLSIDSCMQNRIFSRNRVVGQYREGQLSFDEAMLATLQISHPGDRDHAVRLLRNEQAYQQSRPPLLPAWDYMGLVWTQAMKPTIFGLQAHISILKSPRELLPYNLVLLAAFLFWVRGCAFKGEQRVWLYLGVVALFYFAVLVGYYNHRGYLSSHAPFLGVQGRYIFPVLVPAYLVCAQFLLRPFQRVGRIIVLVVVAGIFIAGDFPYYLRNDGGAWYSRAGSSSVRLAGDEESIQVAYRQQGRP